MIFRPQSIEGTTLGDTWFQLLLKVWDSGRITPITEGSHKGGKRLEFDFVSGFIHYPHVRPLAPIFPGNVPDGIKPPTTDEAIEQYFANYLMDPNKSKKEEYRYSTWINTPFLNLAKSKSQRSTQLESQVEWVIRHFQEKGLGNNHCYINVGYVDSNFAYDAPYANETERRTSPCLRGIDFKVKENELIVSVIFRSWDLYAGWPENMGGFTLLNEYVAEQIGVKAGPMAFTSAGLHCYDYQIEPLKILLRK